MSGFERPAPLITALEALVVGPDEAIVLRVPVDDVDLFDDFTSAIKDTPFEGRVLLLGKEVEVSVVKK